MVIKYKTIVLDPCDSLLTAGNKYWIATYGITATLDTVNQVEGSACINGGTTVGTQTYFGYSKEYFIDIDMTDCILRVYVYITELDNLNDENTITLYLGNNLIQGSNLKYRGYKHFQKSELIEGWNLLEWDISNEGSVDSAPFTVQAVKSFRINFNKDAAATLIALGDVKIDYVHLLKPLGTSREKWIETKYPFTEGREGTTETRVGRTMNLIAEEGSNVRSSQRVGL